jgi:hypothetical protein
MSNLEESRIPMETMNSPASHSDDLESRILLELRLEGAAAEVEFCRTQLMAISRRHPSLRWLND